MGEQVKEAHEGKAIVRKILENKDERRQANGENEEKQKR